MENHENDVQDRLLEQSEKAVNFLITGVTLLAAIGVPFSVSRFLYTGWQLSYSAHCVGLLMISFLFLFRHNLSQKIKLYSMTLMALLISIMDLFSYGLYGNGLHWGAFTLMLLFFFFKRRDIIIGSGVILTAFLGSMYQFVYTGRQFPGDANVFLSQFSSWGTTFFGGGMFVVLLAYIFRSQKTQTRELLLLLDEKNKQIAHIANHDTLTGLPTLRLALERLDVVFELARRNGGKFALMFLDLDGFKQINDTYGHDAGDDVLREIADRLTIVLRKSDTVGRIGGDEFLIILSEVKGEPEIQIVSNRLIDKISEPMVIKGCQVNVGASIGVALYPDHADNPVELRIIADELMYSVKRTGKNNFAIAS